MSSEWQEYDDSDAFNRPVQAFRFRTSGPKNETENARTLCRELSWRFNNVDAVTEHNGTVVGQTIEDVAAAMIDAGWIIRGGTGGWVTDFNPIPRSVDGDYDSHRASSVLRSHMSDGKHDGWRAAARKR